MAEKDGITLFAEYLQILRNSLSVLSHFEKYFGFRKWCQSNDAFHKSIEIKIEDAKIAKSLGYLLCHCRFPPAIMTIESVDSKGVEFWVCPCCGRETVTTKTSIQIGPFETPHSY